MKDIKRLFFYGGLSVAVILLLINVAGQEGVSSGTLVFLAIFFVVILPVVLSIWMVGKQKR
ncbi:MAG: hypothetical protein OEZ58_22165 [Gammaproteobacteria bacterium]|nr:hypothetical protein [Gammaproteobacteria bacterium]MDH5731698.1 hypothetical protein [Gammaproteobacteria bacterium]